eukprot:TRINITY_DN4420_c0_g1_i1.p1 TRINITY_DN4420_c0_g1~~TRINITY_DN4420_c0_g1_i1.p1  ORF type:complete len:311 (+),score=48.18 TRINITY_DN4420_c0_g1_i1:3-935(+)
MVAQGLRIRSRMSLKLVIIGAGGLVGARLSEKCIQLKDMHISPQTALPLKKILLFDVSDKGIPDIVKADPRVSVVLGDLCDKDTMKKVVDADGCTRVTTIHLAALLSGPSELDFDLGMKINLFGTINVMDCIRELSARLGSPQIYVYTSTDYVAAFNEYNKSHPVNEESFRLSPVSYGAQKACNELLVCDYTRKNFLDGRVARLSAVIGRPGFSNSISYPYTGIFTETLAGKHYKVSLPMDQPYPCSSLNNNVDCMLYVAGKLDADQMKSLYQHNVVIQFPAKSWTLNIIWAATQDVAKKEGIQLGILTR